MMAIVAFKNGETSTSTVVIRVCCEDATRLVNVMLQKTSWTLDSIAFEGDCVHKGVRNFFSPNPGNVGLPLWIGDNPSW